jgi:3-methylcrotonyl-CoA carboxylase alpha subunit
MEMNTRLQVEHPVTECITGIDLVEWQLRVAQGEPLPREAIPMSERGCAIEARLYAEAPANGYLPSVGRIDHLRWPAAGEGVRLDVGVDANDAVSSFYDPMLGKLIAFGATRELAIERLRQALAATQIVGVTTNRALLLSILGDGEFRSGGVGTNFLAQRQAELNFAEPAASVRELCLCALWLASARSDEGALWDDTRGWRLAGVGRTSFLLDETWVTVRCDTDQYLIEAPATQLRARLVARGPTDLICDCEDSIERMDIVEVGASLHLFRAGRHLTVRRRMTDDALQSADTADQGSLLTPLPGTVVAVHVKVGEAVERGAPLVTVEAMKMEHTLTAPHQGVVARIAFKVSERVTAGAVLVEFAARET